MLKRYGYQRHAGCGKAELCPAFSLPDLFTPPATAPTTSAQVAALLDAVPPYFSQAVITPDRRTATLAFGIRLMPLDAAAGVIDACARACTRRRACARELAGLPVLAAEANAARLVAVAAAR